MDDHLPSGAEILVMHHPSELFGQSLGDARAVRRYWARLARAFRDTDAQVFQHARWLFERARDAGDTSPAEPPTATSSPNGVQPTSGVSQWLAEGDFASLAAVVEHDPGSIPQHARMVDVLFAVVRGMGPELTEAQLAAVQRELAHDSLRVSPTEEIGLRLAIEQSNIVRRMRQDTGVHQRFTELVDAARSPDVPAVITAMNRVVAELSAPTLRQVLTYARVHHPGAWSVVRRRMLWLGERGRAVELDDYSAARLFAAYVDCKAPSPWGLALGAAVSGVALAAATSILLVAVLGMDRAMAEDMTHLPVVMGFVGFFLAVGVAYSVRQDGKKAARQDSVARIVPVAREFGLFPSETVLAIVSGMRPSTAAEQFYTMTSALVTLEADPNVLFACWSDALVARFEDPPTEPSA